MSASAAACARKRSAFSRLLAEIIRTLTCSPYWVSNSCRTSCGLTVSCAPASFRSAIVGQMMSSAYCSGETFRSCLSIFSH